MAYVPQVGHAVCDRRFSLQVTQVTRFGTVVFHWARRLRVLERDIFRFGTGTVLPYRLLLLVWLHEAGKCRPP